MKHRKRKVEYILKKSLSIIISVIIIATGLNLPGFSGLFNGIALDTRAYSEIDRPVEINNLKELYQFARDYSSKDYQRVDIILSITGIEISSSMDFDGETIAWKPIGTANKPFGGRITISTAAGMTQSITANEPIFDYIMDSVEIRNINDESYPFSPQIINLIRNVSVPEGETKPLFANYVVQDTARNAVPAVWNISVDGSGTYSGIIGTVGTGTDEANVTLNLALFSAAAVEAASDVGLVCGAIQKNSSVTVNFSQDGGSTDNSSVEIHETDPIELIDDQIVEEPEEVSEEEISEEKSEEEEEKPEEVSEEADEKPEEISEEKPAEEETESEVVPEEKTEEVSETEERPEEEPNKENDESADEITNTQTLGIFEEIADILPEMDYVEAAVAEAPAETGEISGETGGETGEKTGSEVSEETGGETGGETGSEVSEDAGGETGEETGSEVSEDADEVSSEEAGGETSEETGSEVSKDADEVSSEEAGEETSETKEESGGKTDKEIQDGLEEDEDLEEGERSTISDITSITSSDACAGGFVGKMYENSMLLIVTNGLYEVSSAARTITAGTYAGGLAGFNDRGTVVIKTSADSAEVVYNARGTVSAATAAGGVFGYYKLGEGINKFSPAYYTSINGGCTLSAATAGAIVGELEGNGEDVSYSGTNENRVTVQSSLPSDSDSIANYGGIVGAYTNTDLAKTFITEYVDVRMSGASATNYGGAIAKLAGNTPVYVKINEFTMNSSSGASGCTYFGGAVGTAGSCGSMIDVGNISVTTSGTFTGGGVLGRLTDGVLRLSGVTNLSTAVSGGAGKSQGQIVGERTNGLVYALGSGEDGTASYGNGWRFVRSSTDAAADDVGTWGEVVRFPNAEVDSGALDTSTAIFVYDGTAHTVTVAEPVYDMTSAGDFVKTALNLQLNDGVNKGALHFAQISKSRSNLLAEDFTVSGTIDLSGTGITGLMRDGSLSSDDEVRFFTGSLGKGESDATIRLATGERYGIYTGSANGRGAIHAHKFNGLLARTGDGAKVSDITIEGTMNIEGRADMYIGGAVAYLRNGAALTNVNVNETINYNHSSGHQFVGGLIGTINCDEGKTVTIQGEDSSAKALVAPVIKVTGSLVDNDNNGDKTVVYQAVGGMIGNISSTGASTINISNITLSAEVDASAATAAKNVSVSGLISDIAWSETDTRTLNLSYIDVTETTVKHKANISGGGMLGYRWFGTDVKFDHVVLASGDTSNEINTNAICIGGLVYRATGNWYVLQDGIDIESLAIKNGSSAATPTSLGIVVHDGYYAKGGNVCGIFLEMTDPESYTLASGLTIPVMTNSYDELVLALAADSDSILTNNTAGVISYATGGEYSSAEGIKNSYNNVYNTTAVNNRSRYYYNADRVSYTNNGSEDEYKLLFWSLNRYAATNIKRCFTNPFPTDVLSGTFNLEHISYYPIDIAKKVTLSDADVIFYNAEIEETETASDTKRSTRSGNSQHYLMHMGLFRNVSSTVDIIEDNSFSGSVGTNSTYSGVLVNGLLTGTLKTSASGTMVLGRSERRGKKDYYYPLELADLEGNETDRFLLINTIGNKAILELNELCLQEDAYEVFSSSFASSLIGNVQGTGINLKFNRIGLDSRNSNNSPDLSDSYLTPKSIFEHATLLNKYDVDSTSVAIYNFSQTEDWVNSTERAGMVTYGKELTDTVEYRDETTNLSEESRYYEDGEAGNYIDPENYPTASTTEYNFSTNFLPYVRYYNSSVSGAPAAVNTLREIKVNVVPSDLQDGCGTYDHPYVITGAKQLVAVANMLDAKDGYTPIPNIMLPTNKTDTSHWCLTDATTHSCKLFTYNGTNYTATGTSVTWNTNEVRAYLAKAYYQIGQDITLGTTFTGLGAYDSTYAFKGVIVGKNDSITITNKSRVPLIKISNGSVVKNVNIVVDNYYNKAHQVVSSMTTGSNSIAFGYGSSNFTYVYGGVIGNIMGGDNIIDNVTMTYSSNNTAYVKIPSSYLACVGGYVGVIVNGGLIFRNMTDSKFVSRSSFNVNSNGSPGTTNWVAGDNYSHLYINPYVGRVINGYAINETISYSGDTGIYTLDNGTKNYQIVDVKVNLTDATDASAEKLYYDTFDSKNRVNIPTGQSLFILSLITQSGAGTATTVDGDYAYGVGYDGSTQYNTTSAAKNVATHVATYDGVGTITFAEKTAQGSDYAVSTVDKLNDKKAIPYIIYHYTKADSNGKFPARMMTGNTSFMKLTTTDGTYNLPKSFRGIGSICYGGKAADTNNPYQMHIYGFDGNSAEINLQTIFNSYADSADNYNNMVYGSGNINLGIGLFNVLIQTPYSNSTKYKLDEGYYVGKFTLTGKINVNEYSNNGTKQAGDLGTGNNGNSRNRFALGGLSAGILAGGYANLYDLDLNTLELTGTTYVAGYIGRNNITEKDGKKGDGGSKIYVNGCDTTATIISGSNGCCGGIVGGSISGYPSIYVNTARLKSGDTHPSGTDGYYKTTMELSISCDSGTIQSGIGGIIGTLRNGYGVVFWINNVTVKGCGTTKGFINNSTSSSNTKWYQGAGGLFGFARKADSIIVTNCEIINLNVKSIYAGGLFGNIDFFDDNSDYGTSPVIKIANCTVSSDDAETYSIVGVKGAGGITGQFTSSKAFDMTVSGYDEEQYKYDVDGCEISNYTISQTGTANEMCGAGGLFGFARATYVSATDAKMRTVVNTSVHDCVIRTDGSRSSHGMGAVIGCVPTINSDVSNSGTIVIDDSGTTKSTKKACGNVGAYNIACYNNTFNYNGSSTLAKVGNFVGNANSSVFKVVGFTRKNNKIGESALTDDYGSSVNSDSYVIDADYMNVSTTESHGSEMAVGFDNGTNVGEGARKLYFPFVTVSPKMVAGTTNFLTGDGVEIVASQEAGAGDIPLAKLIAEESSGTAADNRIAYKTVTPTDVNLVRTLISKGEDTSQDYDVKITTYFTEMGRPSGYTGEDFPIIAIGGEKTTTASGYNDEINAYIRLLTNTTDSYNLSGGTKFVVDIYPCQYISGNYQKVSGTPGLKLANGKFQMDDENADSIAANNQISMIDIRFFDPTDSAKAAYHLYVPVLTKKMLKFDFSSSALQGTEYEPGLYEEKFPENWGDVSKLAAGFDNWQTVFLQFDYSKEEMDKFLKSGKGLNWNTSKTIYYSYNGNKSLADSTQFVLLDNNSNADKEYYLEKSGIDTGTKDGNKYDIIEFSHFKTKRNGEEPLPEEQGFEPQLLKYIAGDKITYTADSSGAYVECSEAEATVIAYSGTTKKYFKAGTSGTKYKLEVKEGETISETYYLSMYTFGADNTITSTTHDAYGFIVECPLTFPGNVITCQRNRAKNSHIFLGEFLKQTLAITDTNQNAVITSSNNTLYATLTATVEFSGDNKHYFYQNLAGEKLYQGFVLNLERYKEDGSLDADSTIKGQPSYSYDKKAGDDEPVTISGALDEGEAYLYVEPIEIQIPAYDSSTQWSSTQTATVNMNFGTDETKLLKEFPARSRTLDYRGIKISARAKLNFARERVLYSNNFVKGYYPNGDQRRYYIDRTNNNGILTITALEQPDNDEYDKYGKQSHNKSALGVNGKYLYTGDKYNPETNTEHIEAGFDYDVSNLPDEVFDGTHTLDIRIVLEQKVDDNTDGFKYVPVNIDDREGIKGYLENFEFIGKEGEGPLNLVPMVDTDGGYKYYTFSTPFSAQSAIKYTASETQKHFNGNINFDARTSAALEAIDGYKYSNYRLKVTASVSDTSFASTDWIVYTNAKLNAEYVKSTQ